MEDKKLKKAQYDKEYRAKNKLKISETKRKWQLGNPDKVKIIIDRWVNKNQEKNKLSKIKARAKAIKTYPEKFKARSLVWHEVKAGRLIKKDCEVCGNNKVEGHHEDYNKPLEVIWMCKKHHEQHHKNKKALR